MRILCAILFWIWICVPTNLDAQDLADYSATLMVGGTNGLRTGYVEIGGGLRNFRPGPNEGTSLFYYSSVLIPAFSNGRSNIYGIKPGVMYHGLFNVFSVGASFTFFTNFGPQNGLNFTPEIGIGTGAWRIYGGLGVPITKINPNDRSIANFGVQILINVKPIYDL